LGFGEGGGAPGGPDPPGHQKVACWHAPGLESAVWPPGLSAKYQGQLWCHQVYLQNTRVSCVATRFICRSSGSALLPPGLSANYRGQLCGQLLSAQPNAGSNTNGCRNRSRTVSLFLGRIVWGWEGEYRAGVEERLSCAFPGRTAGIG